MKRAAASAFRSVTIDLSTTRLRLGRRRPQWLRRAFGRSRSDRASTRPRGRTAPRVQASRCHAMPSGRILDQVIDLIVVADLFIGDITTSNPNVFYEIGLRHMTAKPCMLIAHQGVRIPFDLAGYRVFMYSDDQDGIIATRDSLQASLPPYFALVQLLDHLCQLIACGCFGILIWRNRQPA
jgi:hypothetical protein